MVSPDHVSVRDVPHPRSRTPVFWSPARSAQLCGRFSVPRTRCPGRSKASTRRRPKAIRPKAIKRKKCCRLPLVGYAPATAQRTTEECGRSAAQIAIRPLRMRGLKPGKNCRYLALVHSAIVVERMVDKANTWGLYTPLWTRRRLARWRVREAPHCSHGDRASGHALNGHVRVAASDERVFVSPAQAGEVLTTEPRGSGLFDK